MAKSIDTKKKATKVTRKKVTARTKKILKSIKEKVVKPKKEKVVKAPKVVKEKPIKENVVEKTARVKKVKAIKKEKLVKDFVEGKSKKTENFLFKIISCSKKSEMISKDGKKSLIGTYDFSTSFKKEFHSLSDSIIGNFSIIPVNKLAIGTDGNLVATIMEDSTGNYVQPGNKNYDGWKAGLNDLWKCEYTLKVKVPGKNKASIEDLKTIFNIK